MKCIMKKSIILAGAVIALSFAAISCEKETVNNISDTCGKVHMTIIASGDAGTKTVLQSDGKTVLWDSEEQLAVLETIVSAEETKTKCVASSNGVSTDGGKTMTFGVDFDKNVTGTSYTYYALYPNSSYITNNNTDPEVFKVITPTTQKATATSYDGDADLLISRPVTKTTQQTNLNLAFKRMVVVGKMTLTNVDTDGYVKSVKFSSVDKVITGKSKLDLTTGEVVEYGYDGVGNKVDYVEITYAANDIPANNLTVYFTCLPFEINAGEKFTVTLTTKDDLTFTREVTIPEGRKLSFAVGKNTKFSVDMSEATSGENESLADKDYVIVSRFAKDGTISGNYVYMTSTLSSTSTKYYIYGTTGISAKDEIDVTNSKVDFPDITDYWTIVAKGDNYAIKSKTTEKYVSWTSENSATQSNDPYELKISAVDDIPGLYKVSSIADATRFLQYNGNSGQERFAFYTGTQNDIFLIPVGEDYVRPTLESIEVSNVETVSFFVGDSFVFDGKVMAVYDDGTTKNVTSKATVTTPDMTTAGTKSITITYIEGEITKTASYDITVNEKPVIQMMHFNSEDWEGAEKTVPNAQGSFSIGYTIANPIGTSTTAQVTIVAGSDWVTASNPSVSSSEVTQAFSVAANSATGAPRSAQIKLSYPETQDIVFEVIQSAGDDYVAPTEFSVWKDDFSGCKAPSSNALSALSGSSDGFTGDYSALNKVYPMASALKIGSASASGSITTPVLSKITNSSANLTITIIAAGWKGKTTKLTLTTNKGSVTEEPTTITSEDSMSGNSPSMTGSTYTFHVTGADNTTTITITSNYAVGISDLVITQTN